jgi:hypothetical protein
MNLPLYGCASSAINLFLVSHRCGGNAMEPMMQMRILTLLNRQQETEDADREERRAEREDQQQQNMMILLLMTTIM